MNNVSQKVIKTIEDKRITPKPKWEFLLKNCVIWILFGITVFIGSLAVSVIIFMVKNSGLDNNFIRFGFAKLILIIPYFWILILGVFLFLAYYNFKHTKKGYKYNPYLIIIISVLISIVLGVMIYGLGMGERLERIFYQRFPIYKQIMENRGRIWMAPEQGRLAGIIIDNNNISFALKSFSGKNWVVILENEELRQLEFIKPGIRVKMIGQPISENEFIAEQIAPWFDRMPHSGLMKHHFERK